MKKQIARNGSKQKILDFFLKNKGRIVTSSEVVALCGGAANATRRLRELRDEEGYQILSFKDRADLKPGQYLLETDKRRPAFARGISKETRAFVLDRNGFTCQSCGFAASDEDHSIREGKCALPLDISLINQKGARTSRTT